LENYFGEGSRLCQGFGGQAAFFQWLERISKHRLSRFQCLESWKKEKGVGPEWR
jgi:hypothetical protein